MNKNALIIIAKHPEAKNVKTRLKGHLPDKKLIELYTSLFEHTVKKLQSMPGVDTFIAFALHKSREYFSRFKINLIPLADSNLGDNMYRAFTEILDIGYQKAVLVGADIPELSPLIILKAFDLLSQHDLVYGPAMDGGYYLIGMKRLIKEVFENVPWSSNKTLKKSLEQAKKYGYNVAFTEMLNDVDTIEDVKRIGFD